MRQDMLFMDFLIQKIKETLRPTTNVITSHTRMVYPHTTLKKTEDLRSLHENTIYSGPLAILWIVYKSTEHSKAEETFNLPANMHRTWSQTQM